MGRNVRVICTVGTSLLGGHKVSDVLLKSNAPYSEKDLYDPDSDAPLLDFIQNIFRFDEKGIPEDREKFYRLLRKIPSMTDAELSGVSMKFEGCRFPTAETQTIIRWLGEQGENISRLRVILLPSRTPVSELNAHAACVCIGRLKRLFPNTEIIYSRESDTIIPLPIDVNDREKFLSSVSGLFKTFDGQVRMAADANEEAVICSTGSFKAISGFAMLYAQINSIPCLYTFETSPSVYELMNIPLGYAYTALDEEINILKAIKNHVDFDAGALPRWVQDSRELADVLLESYRKAREKPYGTGEALFERLRGYEEKGERWADYLHGLLVHNWSQLWVGDQIPETVEHSRRHSKRLMEFTANLFRCAEKTLEALGFDKEHPEMLALLIATIYLHDIGHTALSYPLLSPDMADVFPLGLFPSSVREVHHLLTGALLREQSARERYFTRKDCDDRAMADILMRCVPLISEHHRGYTKLIGETARPKEKIRRVGELLFGKDEFAETLRPLDERYAEVRGDCPLEPEYLMNLAALMRIIDGCDVQTDRVISTEYLDYRNQRSEDETMLLALQLRGFMGCLSEDLREKVEALNVRPRPDNFDKLCNAVYPLVFRDLQRLKNNYSSWDRVRRDALPQFMALSLANRVAFKSEQYLHFSKHQHVGFVLPVFKGGKITVKVFPNSDFMDTPEGMAATLKRVCEDIEGEYSAVENILGNKIVFGAEIAGGRQS